MKISVQYVSDNDGNTKAVQLPITDWEKILNKIEKYEQTLKMKSSLREAFEEVSRLKFSKVKKQSLTEFLNEI